MPVVKINMNRQITIPKQIFDEMGLQEGEYVEVARHRETVVVKPKKFVDSEDVLTPQQKAFIDQRLAEGLKDLEEGVAMSNQRASLRKNGSNGWQHGVSTTG